MANYKPFYTLSSLLPFTLMDRYLLREMLPPFLFGVGAFSSIGVTVDAAFDLVRKIVESGLSVDIALQVFVLRLPEFIVLSFPMSTLLATLMTYSRLSGESELVALRGCGVSVYRMVLTAVMLSLIVTGLTFVFNEQIAPAAKYQATTILQEALKQDKSAIAKKENFLLMEKEKVENSDGDKIDRMKRLYYADMFDGKQFKGVTIIDRAEKGVSQIIVAQAAQWNPEQKLWELFSGTSYLVATDSSFRDILKFQQQQLRLPRTMFDLALKSRDYGEMNIAQALEQLEIERLTGDDQKIRKLEVRIQGKCALPFVCVVFGLVGSAMGSVPQRSGTGRGTSFGISVIVIFSYYLLNFITQAMGQSGVMSPFLGAWLPNILGLSVGIFLLTRVAQR